MTSVLDRLIRIRPPHPDPVVAPGVYDYVRDNDGQIARLHLRADESGGGVLVANAALAARLSAAGVFLTKKLLDGAESDGIVRQAQKLFAGATATIVRDDLARLQALIGTLGRRGGALPVVNLQDASFAGQRGVLEKPIVADVPFETDKPLKELVRRLWDQGIVHVIFVLPAQFEQGSLRALIELAEDLGMIAGVRGTATAMAAGTLIEDLAMAGIDHVNLFYLSADDRLHDGLLGAGDHSTAHEMFKRLRENEVCPVAEIPLLEENLAVVDATLAQLVVHDVENAAFFAYATDLPADADHFGALSPGDLLQTAATIEEIVEVHGLNGTWYAPVLRDPGIGVAEQIRRGPRASGDNAVRITADGNVYPARGPLDSAGNLLEQDWAKIQASAVYARYVERVTTPTRCDACPGLAICAADCPRSRTGWSDDTVARL